MSYYELVVRGGPTLQFRRLPTDDDWRDGAARAIARHYGRSASAWDWREEGQCVNGAGQVLYVCYSATVVGRPSRHDRSLPILGEVFFAHYMEPP